MGRKKLGLIVNPVAGIGGRVGLKGSDGPETQRRAVELGAVKTSPGRAVEALRRLVPFKDRFDLITYPGEMGEEEAIECGFSPTIVGSIAEGGTTPEDTKRAAREMLSFGVDLILFAGGDGTARDMYEAVDGEVPVLGIPAGVKIHSGVFAVTPGAAGELAARHLTEGARLREAEVMDVDEDAFREGRVSARLYGYMEVPFGGALVQNPKEASGPAEDFVLRAIAADVVDNMEEDAVYIIGPGSTTRPIAERLGLEKTLLGVDVVQGGALLASDANEARILELIKGREARIVVTVIGGQGFVLGRGNQQISPEVVRVVGVENVIIVSTPEKLASLGGAPLLVDTGDPELDSMLCGYHKIVTGYGKRAVYRVGAG